MQINAEEMFKGSLNLTESQWSEMIAKVESGRGPGVPATQDRRDLDQVRVSYVKRAALRVTHPDNRVTSHLIRTRNLSVGGVSFIHGCFLYPKTRCYIALATRHGEGVALSGTVSWCRHVQGRGHEVGFRFDRVIQVDEFIDPDAGQNAA